MDDLKSWILANAHQSRRPEVGDLIIKALDELETLREENRALKDQLHSARSALAVFQDGG